MELVLTLLVVGLLVVLPIAFFLLVIGGLVYAIGKAILGEKKAKRSATPVVAPGPTHGADVPAVKVASANGNKGA
jgi:hypothetical protein